MKTGIWQKPIRPVELIEYVQHAGYDGYGYSKGQEIE